MTGTTYKQTLMYA